MECKTKQVWIGVGLEMMKTIKVSAIYFQIAEKLAKKKGKKMENYIADLISEEFNRQK